MVIHHLSLGTNDLTRARAFYDPVLAVGAPGLRPEYNANYYGAFVRDPDGGPISAIWRQLCA